MAHAAARVGDVAVVARDQVDVQVEDGLAGGFADVDADVEAVGAVAAGDQLSASVEAGGQGRSLLGGGVEPGGDVPSRDDEQVAFADREGVPEGPREAVFEGDAVLGGEAEGARGGCRHGVVVRPPRPSGDLEPSVEACGDAGGAAPGLHRPTGLSAGLADGAPVVVGDRRLAFLVLLRLLLLLRALAGASVAAPVGARRLG